MEQRDPKSYLALVLLLAVCWSGCASSSKVAGVNADGLPTPDNKNWCKPMPELGSACKTSSRLCAVACDPESGRCAFLKCEENLWMYVETADDRADDEP